METLDEEFQLRVYSTRDEWRNTEIEAIDSSECLEYLRQRNSILIVDCRAVLEGFEWPTIIYDFRVTDVFDHNNEFFRAMAQFITITDEEREAGLRKYSSEEPTDFSEEKINMINLEISEILGSMGLA